MHLRMACVFGIVITLFAGWSPALGQAVDGKGYTIKQVRLSNDSPATQILTLEVTLADAEGIEIPLGNLDPKTTLKRARRTIRSTFSVSISRRRTPSCSIDGSKSSSTAS
jgi:hypothetical protein